MTYQHQVLDGAIFRQQQLARLLKGRDTVDIVAGEGSGILDDIVGINLVQHISGYGCHIRTCNFGWDLVRQVGIFHQLDLRI